MAAPTPTPASGVRWVIDFSTVRIQAQAVMMALQVVSFFLIMFTVYIVYSQFARNKSLFWKASLAGVLLLSPINLFEIAFSLSQWTAGSLWSFPTMLTMICDILLRTGYCVITICRFWRLKLIAPMHQQLATQLLRYTSVFVVFVTLVSLYSSISLHTVELVEGQDGAVFRTTTNAKVLWFRDQDRFLQFATFLIIHLLNLVCDFLFIRAIVTSMQQTNQKVKLSKEDRNRMLLPYIPPSIITVFYVLASILVVTKAKIPALSPFIVTTSIALSRIAPVVETFAFYCFAVNHTRLLLKNMSRTGSNSQTGARSGVTTGVGYSGYIRSQVGVSSNPFISTSGGDKGTIRGVTKFSDAPMPLAPFTRPAPPAPVAHGYGSAGTSGTGASSSAYGTQATAWSSQQSQTYDAPTTQGAPGRKTSRGAVSSSSGTLSRPHY